MNAADKLRAEIADQNKVILETIILPKKEQILNAVTAGIKRIGYVQIDTSGYHAGTCEGQQTGIHDRYHLNALADWLREQGFKVSKSWWGWGSHGDIPDMLKITL